MTLSTVKGTSKARVKKTSLQIDLLGAMIDRGVFSQGAVAARLRVSPQTLSQHLRGHRKNPRVLRKILEFIARKAEAKRRAA
jgi:hypothetical protein